MVFNNRLSDRRLSRALGIFAARYQGEGTDDPIKVADHTTLTHSALEDMASQSFISGEYTVSSEIDGERCISMVDRDPTASDIVSRIISGSDDENQGTTVQIEAVADGVRGYISMPHRSAPAYTQAAHFLTRLIAMYGSDKGLTLPKLLTLGYEHITQLETAPEGHYLGFDLRPEKTIITLSVYDEKLKDFGRLPFETTELLQEDDFQLKRVDEYRFTVEYSRNPLRNAMQLPSNARYMSPKPTMEEIN